MLGLGRMVRHVADGRQGQPLVRPHKSLRGTAHSLNRTPAPALTIPGVRDGLTLDEVWPNEVPYGEHWWVNPVAWLMDDRPVNYWDRRR